MSLQAYSDRAAEIRELFRKKELVAYGREWSREDILLGLVGDMGDLAKIALAQKGVRDIKDADKKIRHELADCFWSLLVLAREYGVDLDEAFFDTMNEIEKKIK